MERMPHACIGSDLIVGFPGETLERFEATVAALDETPMHYLHVFSYSARSNTPAVEFEDAIPERDKRRRAQVLRDWSAKRQLVFQRQFIGQVLDVIVEDGIDDEGRPKGLSENYIKVKLQNGTLLPRLELDTILSGEASLENINASTIDLADGQKAVRPNDRVRVRILSVSDEHCFGEVV